MEWVTTTAFLHALKQPGDNEAWRRFVERFRQPVVRYAERGGLKANAAEDLAQEVLLTFVEAWRDGRLVGGLYGIAIGGVFTGESMFAIERDASKVALVTLAEAMQKAGFALIDAQVMSPHLETMGARLITRDAFLARLHAVRDNSCVLTSPL